MTHQVKIAPPVKTTSVIFIAASIAIIEIKDMPIAVLKAKFSAIWRAKINVSRIIEVKTPFIMASVIIPKTGNGIWENWKKAMVPKSPIEQPNKHQDVL